MPGPGPDQDGSGGVGGDRCLASKESGQGKAPRSGEISFLNPQNEGISLVIIDTSVAVKWFFREEEGVEAARGLLERESLGAPDLLLYEFANVLACKSYLSSDDVQKFMSLLYQCPVQFFVLPEKGFSRTLELCKKYKLTAYDASYIALAEALKGDFVTADTKLVQKVKGLSYVHELEA